MNTFSKFLQNYNKSINPVIEKIFDNEKSKFEKISPLAAEFIEDYKNFSLGGKKLRGAEILLGYQMFGGKNNQQALLASSVIEIAHSFLLIHDDIIDQDSLRRGNPTMHKKYSTKFGDHFGMSLAIVVGDEGNFLAYKTLNSLKLDPTYINQSAKLLSELLMEVGLGEALDITYEKEKRYTEQDVLLVHRYKTANYTISGPLSLGAILAGAKEDALSAILKFGIPVGTAFQLRDDELGMFSTEDQIGKPVDSDLKEGKVTLLIIKAKEKASLKEREFLNYAHGNPNLTSKDTQRVRKIMIETRALEYSQTASRKLVEEGKRFIPKVTKNKKFQKLLSKLADYVIERDS